MSSPLAIHARSWTWATWIRPNDRTWCWGSQLIGESLDVMSGWNQQLHQKLNTFAGPFWSQIIPWACCWKRWCHASSLLWLRSGHIAAVLLRMNSGNWWLTGAHSQVRTVAPRSKTKVFLWPQAAPRLFERDIWYITSYTTKLIRIYDIHQLTCTYICI